MFGAVLAYAGVNAFVLLPRLLAGDEERLTVLLLDQLVLDFLGKFLLDLEL